MSDKAGADPRRTVLIADDDPTILLLLEHVLEALGRTFEMADDGAQAWAAWERARHELVVLDIEMPGMNGLDVCRRIRAADPDRETFVLVVTGRTSAGDLAEVLDAGADDYVTKPTTGQRMLARMRIALQRMASDADRRRAEKELREARYLAGIGEALVTLQHEINNPLAGLMATAELLLLEHTERKLPTEDLTTIVAQAQRIADLVKRMGELRNPRSVPYEGDARMLDLEKGGGH
ncbi:MAG: response regulator [Gemmatimonadaceae bacterium]